jgi:hypothetical protein
VSRQQQQPQSPAQQQRSPQEPPSKKRRLAPPKKRLFQYYNEQAIISKRNTYHNSTTPLNISAVSVIDTECRHLGQITKNLSKINLTGLKTISDSAPGIILSDNIKRTYLASHLMPFKSGVIKSCTLNLTSQNLSLYEGEYGYMPNSLGLYCPTLYYDHNGQIVRLSNTLCPYGTCYSLRRLHHNRKLAHFDICGYRVTAIVPPTDFCNTPEGVCCRNWHATNLEVLPCCANFPQSTLEKSSGKFLLLPSIQLIANTTTEKKFLLIQLSTFARLYNHEELVDMVRYLTSVHGPKLDEITAVSSISVRELLTFMPQGIICLVVPSKVCYKLTFAELSRLMILSTDRDRN